MGNAWQKVIHRFRNKEVRILMCGEFPSIITIDLDSVYKLVASEII